jgi:hypothetical protein
MSRARVYAAATLLPDGSVLVAGGSSQTTSNDPVGPGGPAELYDPLSRSWKTTGRVTEARTYLVSTLLESGTVLVTGGRTKPVLGDSLGSAELYGAGSGSR